MCIRDRHQDVAHAIGTAGDEVGDRIAQEDADAVSYTHLYPVLYRLIDDQCISSSDVVENRRVRVYYHMEPKGEEYLQQLLTKYLSWSSAIQKLIERG